MNSDINLNEEEKLWRQGQVLIGVDEAGRGPLAGPVVATAVTLLPISVIPAKAGIHDSLDFAGFPIKSGMTRKERKINFIIQNDLLALGVNDSKKLTPKKREEIFEILIAHPRVRWATGEASEKEIDELNILQASLQAMRRAVEKLLSQTNIRIPDIDIYVDGREVIPGLTMNQKAVIGGDGKIFSIAAASIIAKVTRDRIMLEYGKKYPQYQFEKHKGYGTKLHYEMIKKHGLSPIHRKSFLKKLR